MTALRIAVTGQEGQVARALADLGASRGISVLRVGRPALNLTEPGTILPALERLRPDIVVSAAAYTAVDKAEAEPDLASAVNAAGAGAVAEAAAALGVPVIHLSTDYVFDGSAARPYREDDATAPLGVYGRSKRAGEEAVAAAGPNHVVARTAWIYGPHGHNFVRTMLRLAAERPVIRVVADQYGCPTAATDLAAALLTIAERLVREADPALRGLFHLTAQGSASWADLAEEVFALSAARGGPAARVERIPTSDYPTPARRPASSRLDGGKLRAVYGVTLPPWRSSLAVCVDRLLAGTSCRASPPPNDRSRP